MKSMTETTVRKKEQQHCLGGEYLIREYSWQFFFSPTESTKHENKERMMAGGPIKQYVSMSKT